MQSIVVILLLAACLAYVAWSGLRSVMGRKKPGCGGCSACEAPEQAEPKERGVHFLPADALRRRK